MYASIVDGRSTWARFPLTGQQGDRRQHSSLGLLGCHKMKPYSRHSTRASVAFVTLPNDPQQRVVNACAGGRRKCEPSRNGSMTGSSSKRHGGLGAGAKPLDRHRGQLPPRGCQR